MALPLTKLCPAGMQHPDLLQLPDQAQEAMLRCLHLRDLASLAACSRALRNLLARQPEAVWRAAAESDPAYSRCAVCRLAGLQPP